MDCDDDDAVVCVCPQPRRKQRLIGVVVLLGVKILVRQPDNINSAVCLRRTDGVASAVSDGLR